MPSTVPGVRTFCGMNESTLTLYLPKDQVLGTYREVGVSKWKLLLLELEATITGIKHAWEQDL